MRRTTKVVALALAAALAAGGTTAAVRQLAPGVKILTGGDTAGPPGYTAADVVTYADHLVVVRAVGEREGEDHGEGWVDREVRLRVVDVLWSAPDPSRPVPSDFSAETWGWATGGVVGVGELEGRAVGLEEAKDIAADDATASIGRDLVGRGRDAVVRLVEAARPGRAETYLPPAPCA